MKLYTFLRYCVLLLCSLLFLLPLSACKKESTDAGMEAITAATQKAWDQYVQRLSVHMQEIKEVTGISDLDTVILIDGKENKLFLVSEKSGVLDILAEYTISASKYGYGYERGSNQTPWGVHEIAGKYGHGAVPGMSFYDRRPTGEIATIFTDTTNIEDDPVTSRIIWLRGLEDINHTSYWRFIYIHGTHEEGLLGTPQSKGCIRMGNKDIIELFELVDTGAYVNIIRPETGDETEEE